MTVTTLPHGRQKYGLEATGAPITQLFGVDEQAELDIRIERVIVERARPAGRPECSGHAGEVHGCRQLTIVSWSTAASVHWPDVTDDRYTFERDVHHRQLPQPDGAGGPGDHRRDAMGLPDRTTADLAEGSPDEPPHAGTFNRRRAGPTSTTWPSRRHDDRRVRPVRPGRNLSRRHYDYAGRG
jgi:hypothetical protein